jgi:hypothetical protein
MKDLIFGYTWEQIQNAQQGKGLSSRINPSNNLPKATQGDVDLLVEHGVDKLREMQIFGVIDRLENSGLVDKN